MSDFADVERFAREHAGCGALTPSATARDEDGGYQLTITCACGAVHDRKVTSAEASRPLPRPSRQPAPAAPRSTASWPTQPGAPRPQRLQATVTPARRASRGRVVWFVLLGSAALGAAGAIVLTRTDTLMSRRAPAPRPAAPTARAATPSPAPPTTGVPARSTLDEIARSLRELQTGITPNLALSDYTSRVATTRTVVERLAASAPEPIRAQVRELLDVHRLAASAWRARTVNDKDEWAKVARDPAVELCPSVKRAADAAAPPARGAAVAAALPQLWECAGERLATLDRLAAGG
jgi:hypothetical protein